MVKIERNYKGRRQNFIIFVGEKIDYKDKFVYDLDNFEEIIYKE